MGGMTRRGCSGALLAGMLAAACSEGRAPSLPEPMDAPATPEVEAVAAPNSAPSILGDEVCVGPAGREHVFPLQLTDPDGDAIHWRAETVEPRGVLSPLSGTALAAGTVINLVYSPPSGKDENVILVIAEDGRGGTTVKRLLARSG
jgi:hypothetical protein